MDMEDFYSLCKEYGIQEVILSWDDARSIPIMMITGFDKGGHFKLEFNNSDFDQANL